MQPSTSPHVAITGATGFLGLNALEVFRAHTDFTVTAIPRDCFSHPSLFAETLNGVDVVLHFAGVCRAHSDALLIEENEEINQALLQAMEKAGSVRHLIFSSSIHESSGSAYAQSKREGGAEMRAWCEAHQAVYSHLVLPNIFGPGAPPGKNSVVANFCDAMIAGRDARIIVDNRIRLRYVYDVLAEIQRIILEGADGVLEIENYESILVTELLQRVQKVKTSFLDPGIFPVDSPFDAALYETLAFHKLYSVQPFRSVSPLGASGFTAGEKRSIAPGHILEVSPVKSLVTLPDLPGARVELHLASTLGLEPRFPLRPSAVEASVLDLPRYHRLTIKNTTSEDVVFHVGTPQS